MGDVRQNSGKRWTIGEEERLAALLRIGLGIPELATMFRRSETAIRDKRQEMVRRAQGRVSRYAVRKSSPCAPDAMRSLAYRCRSAPLN